MLEKRVVFLLEEYLPESTKSHAKMIHALAKKFAREGHSTVALVPSNGSQQTLLEMSIMDDVEVWRYRAPMAKGGSRLRRALLELLLPYHALFALFFSSQSKNLKFDICVNYSPTIFLAPLAFFFKKKGAFVYLVLRDFFPGWLVDRGILKERSLATYFFKIFEQFNYSISDAIGVQSPNNIPIFEKIYRGQKKAHVLMNWGEKKEESEKFDDRLQIRNLLGLTENQILLIYGGNMGPAQDMENILHLITSMQTYKEAHFLLFGEGEHFVKVKSYFDKEIGGNASLKPSVSQDEFERYLSAADVGIVSLSAMHLSHNIPGKVLSYLANDLPILGCVNAGNDLITIVNNREVGFISVSGDNLSLVEGATRLLNDEDLRKDYSLNCKNLLQELFSVDAAYKEISERYLAGKF